MLNKPPRQLTERQSEILKFIKDKILERGHGPTVREIGGVFGIRSPNGVVCHLRALERKGLIFRREGLSRAIELTGAVESLTSLPTVGRLNKVNVLESLQSGERQSFADLFDYEKRFAVTVDDDSLASAHIVKGDVLILQQSKSAEDGDVVLAILQDLRPVLRIFRCQGRTTRLSVNHKSKPAIAGKFQISAKAVALIRNI